MIYEVVRSISGHVIEIERCRYATRAADNLLSAVYRMIKGDARLDTKLGHKVMGSARKLATDVASGSLKLCQVKLSDSPHIPGSVVLRVRD